MVEVIFLTTYTLESCELDTCYNCYNWDLIVIIMAYIKPRITWKVYSLESRCHYDNYNAVDSHDIHVQTTVSYQDLTKIVVA